MITFKQFLTEQTLIASTIASLLKKHQEVFVWAARWNHKVNRHDPSEMLRIKSIVGDRVNLQDDWWFELNDDEDGSDDTELTIKKEGGFWTLVNNDGQPIRL